MGENSKIEWCEHTHNHWIGCMKVSPACDGCYAEAMMDKRYGRVQWGGPGKGAGTRSLTSEANRRKPLAWDRKAKAAGTRPFVFCSSLADVFDNQVPVAWRVDLFELIRDTSNLTWLLLTKRPQLIVKLFEKVGGEWPRNAAIGCTVEDQERANLNIPHLLAAKAELDPAFAFLSCEPMLGPIDLNDDGYGGDHAPGWTTYLMRLDWIIAGGESGQKARPTHPNWFRDLRDQCAAADVPFFFKQWGEWSPVPARDDLPGRPQMVRAGDCFITPEGQSHVLTADLSSPLEGCCGSAAMRRLGKRHAGRLLDGIEHNGFPEVRLLT